jgi:hypothetical protein
MHKKLKAEKPKKSKKEVLLFLRKLKAAMSAAEIEM